MTDIDFDLDEFYHLLDQQVTLLTNRIEIIALEKGIPVKRGELREILEDALEDIHIKNFIKNKRRKLEKWFKRRIKGIFK